MPSIFSQKLAARRDPSPSGVFINNLHEPFARILEGPVQTHPSARGLQSQYLHDDVTRQRRRIGT